MREAAASVRVMDAVMWCMLGPATGLSTDSPMQRFTAPYSSLPEETRGRVQAEGGPDFRSAFARDRDRIGERSEVDAEEELLLDRGHQGEADPQHRQHGDAHRRHQDMVRALHLDAPEETLDQQKRQNALLRRLCEANEPEEKAVPKDAVAQQQDEEDFIRLVAER